MKDNRKNPWYYFLPLAIGWFVGGIIGWLLGNHPVAGGLIGWVLATAYFIWKGGPVKPTTTLNSFALPLLVVLVVPEWAQVLFCFMLVALFVVGRTISSAPHISRPTKQPEGEKPWYIKRSN